MHNGCLGRGNVTLMSLNMKLQPRDDDTETLESFAQKKEKKNTIKINICYSIYNFITYTFLVLGWTPLFLQNDRDSSWFHPY